MATLWVPGIKDEASPRPALADTVDGIQGAVRARVEAARAGVGDVRLDGEFAELQLSDGVRLWGTTDQLAADFATGARDGGGATLPAALPLGRRSRSSAGQIAVEAVTTFELEIAGGVAAFIKSKVEKGRERGGQLLQCVTPSAATFKAPARLDGPGPVLVFIHGTASSTDGSFGGLWEAVGANRVLRIENPGARFNDLFEAYQGRVLAFEHRSLSESPITNALALTQQLATIVPGGAELHFVSHSRGGLIGELLCRGMRQVGPPFDETDFRLFAGDRESTVEARLSRQQDGASLQTLGTLLHEQRYAINRFVRVACPAAGTTLADGRLDRYVSMLVNIAGRVSGLAADPLYNALTHLLAAILKERTKPESLPGLEAMMPISPVVRLVNRRDIRLDTPLHVLGGDLAITGFWSALTALATDFYYREDHDLVVNTPSMLRGTPRASRVHYWIDTDGEVSHFNYFRRADTASRLCDLLMKGEADVHELEVEPSQVTEDSYQKRAAATAQPTVILIPGFMGSHLAVDGRVWADPARLAQGGLEALANGAEAALDGLVGIYDGLVRQLSATHDVVAFDYDWRQPAARSGARLSARLKQILDARQKQIQAGEAQAFPPIRILTHGAGGLVLAAMLDSSEGQTQWARMCADPDARAVVLGYPFGGTVHAQLTLDGAGPLVEGLAAIDLVHDRAWIAKTLGDFGGLRELAVTAAPPLVMRDRTRIMFVAGTAEATLSALRGDGEARVVDVTTSGDGYSTWRAIPSVLRDAIRVAPVDHGGLITADEIAPAILELLATGRTGRLGALPPLAEDVTRGTPVRRLQILPSDAELVGAGLGVDVRPRRPPRAKVRVEVVHGNLSRATAPVLVGHYDQDVFANAEDYLDRQLNGRLRQRHLMRLYPGAIGTVAIALAPEEALPAAHPGAIVVGLGVVGELTAGSLLSTLETGLTSYGDERVADRRRRDLARRMSAAAARPDGAAAPEKRQSAVVSAPVTALLVGSGEAGISLRDSIHALLRAVQGANGRLHEPAADAKAANRVMVPTTARIDSVSILELYEDRAVEALRALQDLAGDAEFGDDFAIAPVLTEGAEGRQRVSFAEQAAWWQRLRVTEQSASLDPDAPTERRILRFEAFTERARIDAYAVSSHRALAEAFIGDAMRTTASDQSLGRALFEMLVPNAIKERAPDRRNTVLLLDAASATVPWELFEDGLRRDRGPRRPLAIEAGLVRQLVDAAGRQQVLQAIGNGALVVGNPPVADRRFANLPGAEAEAEAVAAQLAARYSVKRLIGAEAQPRAILAALYERPWPVLHMALHGVFDFPRVEGGKEKVTGAVIGAGMYLSPADFNQMRYVPELVFLNCCHGGNTAADAAAHVPRYPELAANLATQFIKMGAKAVVAAGWAVDDKAATAFARTFYAEMLRGRPFGEATFTARKETHRFAHVNTWGAYQCYGDPDYCLVACPKDGTPGRAVSQRELVLEAEGIANRARSADDTEVAALRQHLGTLVADAADRWLRDARIGVALGAAYGELREFERAIDYYKRASTSEKAHLTGTALEQLANLRGRYAEHLWRQSGAKSKGIQDKVDEELADAQRLLEQLLALNPSSERHALLGGLEKRRAMTRPAKGVGDVVLALQAMEGHYLRSYDVKRGTSQGDPWYPFSNVVVARLALGWLAPAATGKAGRGKGKGKAAAAPASPLVADIATLTELEQALGGATDFWSLGFAAEAELLRNLHGGVAADVTSDVTMRRFRDAQRRGRSRREIDSVLTQVRFMSLMAGRSSDADVRALAAALDELEAHLSKS